MNDRNNPTLSDTRRCFNILRFPCSYIILYYIILYYIILYYIIFIKNRNQLVAQYSFLFVVTSATCFGHTYWQSSGSHMQQCFNLEVSHVVTTVVMFTVNSVCLSFRSCDSCRRLPEPKHNSFLFSHWSSSKCLVFMAARTPSIHVFSWTSSFSSFPWYPLHN